MNTIINVCFPLIGIGIIIFCILSFIFPFGRRFKDKVQKIKGFGLDIEVSILTLIILIGFIFSFTGIYLNTRAYEDEIVNKDKQLSSERAKSIRLLEEIERLEKKDISWLLNLESDNVPKMPELNNIVCKYKIRIGRGYKDVEPKVEEGKKNDQFQITFKDITNETVVWKVELRDIKNNTKWIFAEPFSPFVPELQLRKED